MKNLLLLTLTTLIFAISANAFSGQKTYRCGNDIVHTGDNSSVVRNKCGNPYYQDQTSSEGSKKLAETWTYKKNGQGTALYFTNGKLKEIERVGFMR